MLFRPDSIEKILKGDKTQTRRAWKKPMVKVGGIYPIQEKMFQKKVDCPGFLRVWYVGQERLGDIWNHPADALKEGFHSVREFFKVWAELYGSVHMDQEIWVIDFVLVDGGSQ